MGKIKKLIFKSTFIPDPLYASLDFEDNVDDAKGNLTTTGIDMNYQSDLYGQCIKLNGSTSRVDLGESLTGGRTEFTIAMLFRADTTKFYNTLFGSWVAGAYTLQLTIRDGRVYVAAGVSGYTGTAKIVVKLLDDGFESDFVATGFESVEVGFTQATNTTELMSYVETDLTSVTKVADVCYDGGLKYGFTGPEGYFVATMRTSEEYEGLQIIELGDKTYNNRLAINLSGSLNRVQWICSIGGTQLTGYQQFGVNCSEIHEVGISHNKGFTIVMYVDGVNVNSNVAINEDLTCTLAQLKAGSGSNNFEGRIRGFKYFDNLAQAKEEHSYLIDQ